MADPSTTAYTASVQAAETAARNGGVTFNSGAVPAVSNYAPLTNGTVTWSIASAQSALSAGAISQGQYNSIVRAIEGWRQEQINMAKDTLGRSTGYAH